MKIIERIFTGIILLALLMKFMLWPGGSPLLVIALSGLSCFYLFLGFLFFSGIEFRDLSKKETYDRLAGIRMAGALFTGIALSAACIGVQFKLMHWPGAQPMLISGIFPAFIILFIAFVKFLTDKDNYYKRIISRLTIAGVFGLLLLFTSSLTLMKIQYRDYPEYIKAYEAEMNDPENEELKQKSDLEFHRVTMDTTDFKHYLKYWEEEYNPHKAEVDSVEIFFPEQIGRVNDFEHLLTEDENQKLDSVTKSLDKLPEPIGIIIVTMDTIQRYDTSAYAVEDLLDEWVPDSMAYERSMIIVVSRSQRDIALVAGGNLDEEFPDSIRTYILNKEMGTYFKKGKYYEGLANGIDKIRRQSVFYFCSQNPSLCSQTNTKNKRK